MRSQVAEEFPAEPASVLAPPTHSDPSTKRRLTTATQATHGSVDQRVDEVADGSDEQSRTSGCNWTYDRGYRHRACGAGKKITGRPRYLPVDTLELIPAVGITAASVLDRNEGRIVLAQVPESRYPELLTVFADAGYQGRLGDIALQEHELDLVIVPKLEGQSTFVVLPKRWWWRGPSPGSCATGGCGPTTKPSPRAAEPGSSSAPSIALLAASRGEFVLSFLRVGASVIQARFNRTNGIASRPTTSHSVHRVSLTHAAYRTGVAGSEAVRTGRYSIVPAEPRSSFLSKIID